MLTLTLQIKYKKEIATSDKSQKVLSTSSIIRKITTNERLFECYQYLAPEKFNVTITTTYTNELLEDAAVSVRMIYMKDIRTFKMG